MGAGGGKESGALVFSESADGIMELLTAARGLVGPGGHVTAVAIGLGGENAADCAARGADEVLTVEAAVDPPPDAAGFAAGLLEAVHAVDPHTVVVAATRTGSEVGARLAQSLEAPCASDCMALRLGPEGNLAVERRVYGGRFLASQILAGRPRVATIPPKRFAKAERADGPPGSIRELPLRLPPPVLRVRARAPRQRGSVDIGKAEVVIAAGRGVKRVEDLALLEKFATELGGVLAGSRPLTGDLDWLPVDRRVGLSGQTIKPNLYVACGISGQIEHVVGMKGARTVVAINTDAKAPIHAEADYSLIGDLYELVPALTDACARARRR